MRLIHKLVCYLFGHDKYMPHENRKIWYCARCENGPGDQRDKVMEDYYESRRV